jgi:hypothetical protein
MGWLDGDIDLGNVDWGGTTDGYQTISDIPTGGYAAPDVGWAYDTGGDWMPTVTEYGDVNTHDIDYNPTFPDMFGGAAPPSSPSGPSGPLSYSQPAESSIGQTSQNSLFTKENEADYNRTDAGGASQKSWLDKIGGGAKSLISDKDGDIDIKKLMQLGIGLGGLYAAKQAGKPGTPSAVKTPQQLQAELVQPNTQWTPQQSIWANKFFNEATPGLATGERKLVRAGEGGIKSIIPSRGYASGGSVGDINELLRELYDAKGSGEGVAPLVPLAQVLGLPEGRAKFRIHGGGNDFAEGGEVMMEEPTGPLSHGNFGLVSGEGDGQSDSVPINAAPGEYVFDAETVSMLGNGSNDAGADILDQWREFLREHKREASSDEIGPESKNPNDYLPEGAV